MPAPATPDLGLYLEAERGPTSRHSLQINWDYPVFQTAMAQASGKTRAKAARKALERQLAFSEIAGEDRRPLLVLRECIVCNGTDDAFHRVARQWDPTHLHRSTSPEIVKLTKAIHFRIQQAYHRARAAETLSSAGFTNALSSLDQPHRK